MEKIFRPSPNAFKNTFCVFQEMSLDTIDGLELQYDSKAGSKYYYTKIGMYRLSNHWGRLANSKWRLVPLELETYSKIKLGFAPWSNFYPDNQEEQLYYLEANYSSKTVLYQHKLNPNYDSRAVLRNTFETTKRIKQVRNLFNLTSWAKYYTYDDLDILRKKLIDELIFTNTSLEDIKRELSQISQ